MVVVGQGYVGLPLAMRAVEVGYRVIGFDADGEVAKRLSIGQSHVEDVPAERAIAALATDRYFVTSRPEDARDFDIAVITVPTPFGDGTPDLSFIEAAGRALAPSVRRGSIVILESTTYPGTTEELLVPILEDGSGLVAGEDFHVGYSPERIDPGNDRWDLTSIPKVVSGIDAASLEAVRSFYDTLVERTVAVSGTREAELTKLLENTSASTCAKPSTRPPPSRSVSCLSGPVRASGVTVYRSTRATCRGRCVADSGTPSASWSWPTTSTRVCPTMSFAASSSGSTSARSRCTGVAFCSWVSPTSTTPATHASRLRCGSPTSSSCWAPTSGPQTRTSGNAPSIRGSLESSWCPKS